MTDLIARLEAAEAGSRELDGEVWYAVHEPDVEHGGLYIEQTDQGPIEVLTCELGSKYADCVEHYTTSLDAALALASRVLGEERAISLLSDVVWDTETVLTIRTAPCLLCAAILRTKGSDQ